MCGGAQWIQWLWMSWRDKWEVKPFSDFQEAYVKWNGRTEDDRSINSVVLYIRIFTGYGWQQILLTWKITVVLHNSFMSPCVSFSSVILCHGRCHKEVYKYVLSSLYICYQNFIHFIAFFSFLYMLYEEIVHLNDTVRGSSG